jgi:hypothetical protein
LSSERARLRYTGVQATTFHAPGVGHLEPGAEFEVPACDAERFTRRADVDPVTAGGKRKPKNPVAQAEGGAEGEAGE